MARLASFEVPPAPMPGAKEELAQLLETLHRVGALRVLNGFFGQLGGVSDVALTEINSEAGQNIVGALLAVGQFLASMPADDMERLVQGMSAGEGRSRHLRKPPSLLALFRLMRSPDTRRAMGALLLTLNSIGSAMRKPAK